MKNLFHHIKTKLLDCHEQQPQGHAYRRITRLSGLVTGMIQTGSSHLSDIGSGIDEDIDAHSKTTAAKRFVSNKWTDYDTHFLPFLTLFTRGIVCLLPDNEPVKLVIDGSQMGKHHATLMISLVWKGRGIPICWFVKQGNKGHFKEKEHVDVLQKAYNVLSPILKDRAVVVLGDGEFDGIEVQRFCKDNSWDYVLRTACNTILYENGEAFQAKQAVALLETDCFFIPNVMFTKKQYKFVNFLCWHNTKRYKDPLFLVSSLAEAGDIISYYELRYSIECLFKDLKSNSFNIHKTRLKDAKSIANLIIIAALAFIMLLTLANNNENKKIKKKTQRVRLDRKVLGYLRFAYKLIKYLLRYNYTLNFSFQFSKNLQ